MKKLLTILLVILMLGSCATTKKVIVYKFYAPDPKCTPIYTPTMKHKFVGMTKKEELQILNYNLAELRKMVDTLVLNIVCHREHLKNIRDKGKKD